MVSLPAIGPVLVTPDELANQDNLDLGCAVNGEQLQEARTEEMIFTVAQLVPICAAP